MQKTVVIDYLPECVWRYRPDWAIVAVDVIRATTTAITAAATGRRCVPAPTIEAALALAPEYDHPLLAGESGGKMPAAFEIDNSPSALAGRSDTHRPLILVSSSGTRVIHEAAGCTATYLACYSKLLVAGEPLIRASLARRPLWVREAPVSSGGRPDLLCLDRRGLIAEGYLPGNPKPSALVRRWRDARRKPAQAAEMWNSSNTPGRDDDLSSFSPTLMTCARFRCQDWRGWCPQEVKEC